MEVKIERLTDWKCVMNLARQTANKKPLDKIPSDKFMDQILNSEHSPIRALIFQIDLIDIPYWVSVHLVRHKNGVEHFITTQRSDRTGENRDNKPQSAPVTHTMIINAQAIINISRKRLCGKASKETRDVWRMVKHEMKNIDPILHSYMVPNCIYRGGICFEPEPCHKAVLD